MQIHLVSSLTPDDERRLAPAMLAAIGRVLDRLPVTYSVSLETATGTAIHHSRIAPLGCCGDPDIQFDEATPTATPDRLPSPGGPVAVIDRD